VSESRDTVQWTIWGGVLAAAAAFALLRLAAGRNWIDGGPGTTLQFAVLWTAMLAIAAAGSLAVGQIRKRMRQAEDVHAAALDQVAQLEAHNTLLQIVARSTDVALAFQALAARIARIVPCDRVGLALLRDDGQHFQTYTARVNEEERRKRPRAEVEFGIDRTIVGQVVRAREPAIVSEISEAAPDYLDANVLQTAGFRSALILPLISKGRAVGTLNVVSRQTHAFKPPHVEALRPIAEILAVAYVAQQLQISLGRYRTMEAMSELTLSVATEINSALQTIIGQCDLLEREHSDPALLRDLTTVVRQAQRISELLEKMRTAAHERMREVAASVHQVPIPSSPEALHDEQA
jgi:signal transduction protein with GAF and PtsI domain